MQVKENSQGVTFLGFNQTNSFISFYDFFFFHFHASCAIIGTKRGFLLWRTNPEGLCTKGCFSLLLFIYLILHFTVGGQPIHICEMFFSTSLLAVVCASQDSNFSSNVLYLYNIKVEQIICVLRFNEEIDSVKFSHQ
jgi:hypothetical protein